LVAAESTVLQPTWGRAAHERFYLNELLLKLTERRIRIRDFFLVRLVYRSAVRRRRRRGRVAVFRKKTA